MLKRWLSIVLVTLMFTSNMPRNVSVYAEEDPVVETVEVPGAEETSTEEEELPTEENETVVGEETPPDSGEGNEDVSEINEEAVYIVYEELEAVQVFGDAATDPAMAAQALHEATSLDGDEIDETVEELFREGETESPEDETLLPSLDGTQIEDNFAARWITEDTTDNDDSALLYLRPGNNDAQKMRLQINYALSGEHNYNPGDITITIPAYLFTDRNGNKIGTVTVPYPEDPSTKADFNWKRIGDQIIITNTKKMSAATKGYMQFEYSGITPSQVQDMKVSNDFTATIEVVTWRGNLIGKTTNTLNAQIDTEARINSVNKSHYSNNVARVPASQIPASQRIDGEEEYIVVSWFVYGNMYANTKYEISFTDTIPTVDGHPEYNGFVLDSTAKDYIDENGVYHSGTIGTGTYTNGQTSYYSVKTAYPASQFEKDTLYEFHNNAVMTVKEVDPEMTENTNPNVQTTDPQLVTTASDSDKVAWSFRDPIWIDPQGHFWANKIGNDDKAKGNQTHYSNSTYSDTHRYSGGYYGIYPSALNEIREGKESVQLSYTVNSRGYLMPWTYDFDNLPWEEPYIRSVNNYFKRYLTLTTTDIGLKINGSALTIFDDYTYVSVEILDPYIYDGVPQNVTADGDYIAKYAEDGTFKYTRTNDLTKAPDIKLQIYRNSAWEDYATVSYATGSHVVTLANGSTTTNTVISVPADTENVRTVTTTNVAAIDYDIRPVVKLKNNAKIKNLVEVAFNRSNTPSISVYNGASMNVVCEGEDLITITSSGYDSLRGYTTDTYVIPSKTAKQTRTDYENRLVTIHYTAKVEERSYIPEKSIYNEAVATNRLQHETKGVWYDLLPEGVTPLTGTVKLRDNDTKTYVYTEENYNNSGRTLLIVECDLQVYPTTYRSGDSVYFMDVPSIEFDAIYSFDAIVDFGDYLHNVIAFESGNSTLGSVRNYTGEPDNPYSSNNSYTSSAFANKDEKDWMKNLDKQKDDPNFVYAGAYLRVDILSSARTSLQKDVDVNNEGYFTTGVYWEYEDQNKRDVYEGGIYHYRLGMTSDTATVSKDLILYDFLEEFYAKTDEHDPIDIDAPRWQGYLRDINLSAIIEKGCAPVVYYSTTPNLQITSTPTSFQVIPEVADVTNEEIWIKAEDYPTTVEALNQVRAIAIDCRKKADGTDFELPSEESITAIVRMQAPDGDAARVAIENNAHAYNNAYLLSTSLDEITHEQMESGIVRKDYTKVGLMGLQLDVKKAWSDDSNRDGIRPADVVVHLIADGVDTGKTVTLSATNNWKDSFLHIPYADASGKKIHYTIQEDIPVGYRVTYGSNDTYDLTVTNKHDPELIDIDGIKTWEGGEEEELPESITVILKANGTEKRRQVIKPEEDGTWNYSFANLFKYENGQEINYTVEEVYEPGNASASYEPRVEGSSEEGFNIINTYHPYGEIYVDKDVTNVTDVSKNTVFDFTFVFTKNADGQEVPVFDEYPYEILDKDGNKTGEGVISSNGTISIDAAHRIHIYDVEEYVNYTVTETEKDGFVQDSATNASGTAYPNNPAEVLFVNRYSASVQYNPTVKKTLQNRKLNRYQFQFKLFEVETVDGAEVETLLKTTSNGNPDTIVYDDDTNTTVVSSTATVTFGAFTYTVEDVGKTYHYRVKETNTEKPGITYSDTVYDVFVTISDNGDGTLTATPLYKSNDEDVEDPVFENEYNAKGEITLKAWKELKGGDLTADMFTFELFDDKGNPVYVIDPETNLPSEEQVTATNTADGTVVFNGLKFNETHVGKTFTYVIKEKNEAREDVTYDTSEKRYIVTVVDNGDGTLSFNTIIRNYELDSETGEYKQVGEDNDVPLFTNVMKPGSLSVTKKVTADSTGYDPQTEFKFKVKLIGEGIEDQQIHYHITEASSSASGGSSGGSGDGGNSVPAEAEQTGIPEETNDVPVTDETDNTENEDTASNLFDRIESMLFRKVYAAEEIYKSGTFQGISWRITTTGELIIGTAGVTQTMDHQNEGVVRSWPWRPYIDHITSVKFEGTVKANGSIQNMFYFPNGNDNITTIDVTNFDTTNATDMRGVFAENRALTTIVGIQNLKTDNATKFHYMFNSCQKLTSLDLSEWKTSNVNAMELMFNQCYKLTSLNVNGWNTGKVTNMEYMFGDCKALAALNVSHFNTSNVTSMLNMFRNCESLTALNIVDWNTSKLTNMAEMFYGCRKLRSIDMHTNGQKWNTSKVTKMYGVFNLCYALETADVSGWNTANVTGMTHMFANCRALKSLDVSSFNTEKVTDMAGMFYYCQKLTKLDISNFKTPKVRIFYQQSSDSSNPWHTGFFENCSQLEELYMSNFDTRIATDLQDMFTNCPKLEKIELGANFKFKGNNITNTTKQAILPTPPEDWTSGEWIREDTTEFGPYTPAALRDGYTSVMAGVWVWNKVDAEFTLQFDAGNVGAVGSMADQSLDPRLDNVLPANAFVSHGYVFDHWDDGNSHTYSNEGTIPAKTYSNGDTVVLTAVWTEKDLSADMTDGEFEFTLYEGETATFDDIPAGTAYQVWEETPDGWILVEQHNVSGTITPLTTAEADFTNQYEPGTTSVQFFGTKKLDGFAAEENAFSFELIDDATEEVIETVKTLDGGFIQFSTIVYREAGDHSYTIREVVNSDDEKIQYDTHEEKVTVVVSDNGDGTLSSTVTYDDDGVSFENTSNPGNLRITKSVVNPTDENVKEEFTFKVTFTNEKGLPLDGEEIYWYIEGQQGNQTEPDPDQGDTGAVDLLERMIDRIFRKVDAADGDIASGTYDYISWRITSNWELILGNGGTQTMRNRTSRSASSWPWWNSAYEPYIKSVRVDGTINAQGSLREMFYKYHSNGSGGEVWGASYPSLTSIDLRGMKTTNVTNMDSMFRGCPAVKTINVTGFDTSNVTNMTFMFGVCRNLKTIEGISSFNTGKVTTFNYMFGDSSSLDGLDVSKWNTSNVTNMYALFWNTGLTSIDVSKWNTSKVTTMECMFGNSRKLKELDVSNFDTRNVTHMGGMFHALVLLESLDLSNFNTDKVSDYHHGNSSDWYQGIFDGCTNLRYLNIENFNIYSTGVIVDNMFRKCPNLSEVVLGSKFSFKGYVNSTSYRPYLPTPPTGDDSPYTGKWVEVTGAVQGSYTPEELYNAYNANMAGTWVWEVDNSKAKVIFDGNGGSCTINPIVLSDGETSITTPTINQCRRNGYILTGWNTKADGSGTSYGPGFTSDEIAIYGKTVILYAQWQTTDDRYYEVRHYKENVSTGTYDLYETDYLWAPKNSSQTPSVKDGEDYDGYKSPEPQTITIGEDGKTVLDYNYALARYSIVYDGNGSTAGSMSTENNVIAMVNHELKRNSFVKDKSMFIGWNTEPDGSGESYADCGVLKNPTAKEDYVVTLYAQWLENPNPVLEPSQGSIIVKCKAGETIVIPNLPAGTHYVVEEISTTDHWRYEGGVNENGDIVSAESASATVNNKYLAEGSFYIVAHKKLKGADLLGDAFTFELLEIPEGGTEDDAVSVQTLTNDPIDNNETIIDDGGNEVENPWIGTGAVQFDSITVDQEKIGKRLEYIIREIPKEGDNTIAYDDHIEYVSVTINDIGGGILQAEIVYDDDGPLFTNEQNPGSLKIRKVTQYAPADDDSEFTFTVELKNADGEALTGEYNAIRYKADDTVVEELTVSSGSTVNLKGGEYVVISGLPDGATYTVTEADLNHWIPESNENATGTIHSSTVIEAVFTNRYTRKDIEAEGNIQLFAKKVFEGDVIKEEDELQFQLINEDGDVIETIGPDETDVETSLISFTELYFDNTAAGKTFTYYIKEVDGEHEDIVYSTVKYMAEVDVIFNGTRVYDFDVRYYKLGEETPLGEGEIPVFTNVRNGSFKIVKTFISYEVHSPVTYIFHVTAVYNNETIYDEFLSMTIDETGVYEIPIENLPVGSEVTITEVYGGGSYELEMGGEVSQTITLDEDIDKNVVEFVNGYEDSNIFGYGVTNTYTQGNNGWTWTSGDTGGIFGQDDSGPGVEEEEGGTEQ
ncbi:MAG: BspA family leucine-rich repeat surface protein [Erysipelotrichaceae bacterium]|nr:BspA family leucine-rich repeat surface protein [Erysipelotrichaceae bacterium]